MAGVVFSGSTAGSFTSTGVPYFISIPEGFDYLVVKNQSVLQSSTYPTANAKSGFGAEFEFWPATDTQGQGTVYVQEATLGALISYEIAVGSGFYAQNTTINNPGPSVGITAITNGATPPVVSTPSVAGLIPFSSVVRIFSTVNAQQLGGIDFTVGTIAGGPTFTLAYMSEIATAGTTGTYRVIPYDPYIYPPARTITAIAPGPNCVVPLSPNVTVITLSVTHTYKVGQKVRLIVPAVTGAAFGMTELNEMQVTIVSIGNEDFNGLTNTITVDVNSTSFTAFAWPLTTDPTFTQAQVVPIGENTAIANNNLFFPANSGVNPFNDAWNNIGQVGVMLMAGAQSPAGQSGNIINWIAYKAYNT